MAGELIDLLWRDHAEAPAAPRRGPAARRTTGEVVAQAIALADEAGLAAVTVRALAQRLGMTPMSVYTYMNSRDDLLVLMADEAHRRMATGAPGDGEWRAGLHRIAMENRALLAVHPWLGAIDDPRTALGPGTIAKYDRELHAFDGTALDDLARDAALSFLLDFVRSSAERAGGAERSHEFPDAWAEAAPRLARYLGDGYPLARRVGAAAGETMNGPYDPGFAWTFGLERVLDGIGSAVEAAEQGASPR